MSTRARILVIDDSDTAREIYGSFLRNCAAFVEKPDIARRIVHVVADVLGPRGAAAGGAGGGE